MTRRSLSLALAVAAIVVTMAPAALAGRDLGRLARRCLAAIEEETASTLHRMGRICSRTLEVIEAERAEGDREGAIRAAREGLARVRRVAEAGSTTIAEGAERCVRVLRRHGAGRDLIRPIIDATRAAMRTIWAAEDRCRAAIDRALGGDGRPPGTDPPPRR